MPETKPRELQATSPSGGTGSSNGDSTPPEDSIEQVAKRRRFEQWVASVRPKAPPPKPNANSARTSSSSSVSAAQLPTAPPPPDHADAAPDISVSSNPPPLMSTSPPPAGHAISNPPPSFFPIAPQRESDSTQLYQMVPADLLRKARELQAASEPPAPRPAAMPSADSLREDPWATADERTAVFAPPPELLASVRAAAASAGLIPKDEPAGETSPPSGRITAEFSLQDPDSASASASAPSLEAAPASASVLDAETAKVARSTGVEAAESPSSSPPPASFRRASPEEEAPARARWPWAVAVLVIAASLATLAVRSQKSPPPGRLPNVGAPAR
ncbi:MAG TPA: hypothetical protein VFQ35_07625 [Polyangiaceae bacterium]|nr:hypothetical protein [Polyangiaceae bacterium]